MSWPISDDNPDHRAGMVDAIVEGPTPNHPVRTPGTDPFVAQQEHRRITDDDRMVADAIARHLDGASDRIATRHPDLIEAMTEGQL